MLLSGGRHRNANTSDVILWTSTDGTGEDWAAHSLSAAHNAGQKAAPSLPRYDSAVNSTTYTPRETTSYTSLVALTDTTALVFYSMIKSKKVNTSTLATDCVSWPVNGNHTTANQTERCDVWGDALHDGGTYHYNAGRGTPQSVCAAQPNPSTSCRDGCYCCRTARDKTELHQYTFAMEITLV